MRNLKLLGNRLWLVYVAALLVYFGVMVSPGLHVFFNPDDSTNLFKAWIRSPGVLVGDCVFFWSGAVRPLGQMVYRLLYWVFGWHSYPFRLTCLAILETNLLLIIWFARKLCESSRFRVLVPLIAAFHGALWSIYESTGTIYDMLCLSFILAGLIYYASVRSTGRAPKAWDLLAMALSTIAAFESKEIGFMLPGLFLAMEVILYSRSKRWIWAAVPAGLCSCAGAAGLRYSDNGIFFHHGGYTPSFTWHRYSETLTTYLHLLSFKTVMFSAAGAVLVLLIVLAAALAIRSRLAVFGWAFFLLTLLPLSFASPRQDGYVLYVPYLGVAILFAAFVDAKLRWMPVAYVCALVVLMQVEQRETELRRGDGPGSAIWIEQLTRYASTMCGEWGQNSRIAVFNNPFGKDWQAEFVFNLTCGRRDIHVDTFEDKGPLARRLITSGYGTSYSTAIRFDGDKYRTVTDSNNMKTFIRMDDPLAADYIVHDVSESAEGGWRWTFDRPELQFFLKETDHLKLEIDFTVAGAILKGTGPVTVSFFLNGKALGSMRCAREGDYQFIQPVSSELVTANEVATVAAKMDPIWVSPEDGQHLGIILTAAGFVPREP